MAGDPTSEYFEAHSRDYHPRRLATAVRWVKEMAAPGDGLFDVGCGTGQVLEAMAETGIDRLSGCDTAAAALETASGRVEFTPTRGSILDDEFLETLGTYRFVTMAAVLHHLVGKDRSASREMTVRAVRNALRLVAPGGFLVVVEPTYSPRWAMTALFWAKRILSRLFGNRRLELGPWNNLGAPIVSYYSPDEVMEIFGDAGGRVVRRDDRAVRVPRLPRLLGIRGRWFSTFLAKRA